MIKIPDYRKFRITKIVNPIINKPIDVKAILDTGSKFTILKSKLGFDLGLRKIASQVIVHSDNEKEIGDVVQGSILIRGYTFPIDIVLLNIKGIDLIIGADFMNIYRTVLRFDVANNDIKLVPQNLRQHVYWDKL